LSHRRYTLVEDCPLNDLPVTMDVCDKCRFYRGATSSHHEAPDGVTLRPDGVPFQFTHGWEVTCNWPRDGAYLAKPGDGYEHPGTERAVGGGTIPDIFTTAWNEDDDA